MSEKLEYQLFDRVKVLELDAIGYIYESALPDRLSSGLERVYGVRLDKVSFPKNFVATEVWHCEAKGLATVDKE